MSEMSELTASGSLLAVLASAGWASMDAARKALSIRFELLSLSAALSTGQSLFLILVWWSLDAPLPTSNYLGYGIAAIGLTVAALFTFLAALKAAPLSQSAPLLALTPAICALMEWGVDGRALSLLQGLGSMMGILAALWLTLERGWREARGTAYMLLVALIFSGCIVLDRQALKFAPVSFHAASQACGAALVFNLLWFKKHRSTQAVKSVIETNQVPIKSLFLLLGTIILFVFVALLQLKVITQVPVAPYEALKRGVGVAGAVFFGRFLFGEQLNRSRILAAFCLVLSAISLSDP